MLVRGRWYLYPQCKEAARQPRKIPAPCLTDVISAGVRFPCRHRHNGSRRRLVGVKDPGQSSAGSNGTFQGEL